MDISQLTAKERKTARKELLKMIDSYNKQQKKTRRPSFPLSSPSQDLMYKGVVKVTYDRGYAVQTKSLLLESTTTASETVEQLIEGMGLRGTPADYALEERNKRTGEIRVLGEHEVPLKLQLDQSQKKPYLELRLLMIRDPLALPMMSSLAGRGGGARGGAVMGTDSEDSLEEEDENYIVPKDEVVDHGMASVEMMMEEALQDIPPLVKDIQERLRLLSETITVDGKLRVGLPSRRMLWDILKPQASALVKEIRRLVDIGEFISNKHCSSSDARLMITLLLELTTDHTRELVAVTKQMCGVRGAAPVEFSVAINRFIHQISSISRLVGLMPETLHATITIAHLMDATSPGNFLHSPLQGDSQITGSGAVSGVLIFTVVSALMGLVRAAYEEKSEYFASLTSNILRSAQRALDTIQQTNEYGSLHLHPLRSRVKDMENKIKVAMNSLIRSVKTAASPHPLPYAASDMLLFCHHLTLATQDYLMVAQCASLTHRVILTGWDLMQLPWVKVYASSDSGHDSKSEATGCTAAEQLSSISDSASSTGDSGIPQRVDKGIEHRRSRIARNQVAVIGSVRSPQRKDEDEEEEAEDEDGQGDEEDGEEEEGGGGTRLRFDQLGLRASQLKLPYYRQSITEDDERSPGPSPPETPTTRSVSSDSSSSAAGGSHGGTISPPLTVRRKSSTSGGGGGGGGRRGVSRGEEARPDSRGYLGSDALQKLKLHYHVNKAIAKGAESLYLTMTQKARVLVEMCRVDAKEVYGDLVHQIVVTATRLSEEVGMLEEDVLVSQSQRKKERRVETNQTDIQAAVRDTQLACHMASGPTSPSSAASKLTTAVDTLRETCSITVASALGTAGKHKKALEQAQRMEQEFVSFMTGQRGNDGGGSGDGGDDGDGSGRGRGGGGGGGGGEDIVKGEDLLKIATSVSTLTSTSNAVEFVEERRAAPNWQGSQSSWKRMNEAPLVHGAAVEQLVAWLTYHRAIDAEFADTFLLTFTSFMTPEHLLTSLISRFDVAPPPPQQMSKSQREAFHTDILITIRLRVVHALLVWITNSYDDFKEGHTPRSILDKFLNNIESFLPACAQQLRKTLATNLKSGPAHLRATATGKPPSPLIPPDFISSQHTSFDLLDVNSLELARQLTITFSSLLRDIRPSELLTLGWSNKDKAHDLCPHISCFLLMSRAVSGLVTREVCRETEDEEDRCSIISYFIDTAKSCRDLKNFAGVFAIMDGLTHTSVQDQETMLTESVLRAYRDLKSFVAPDDRYHRYRDDTIVIHQSPIVPHLELLLSDVEEIDRSHEDLLIGLPMERVNFSKRREQAKLLRLLRRHQTIPYNLTPVNIIQKYIMELLETVYTSCTQ